MLIQMMDAMDFYGRSWVLVPLGVWVPRVPWVSCVSWVSWAGVPRIGFPVCALRVPLAWRFAEDGTTPLYEQESRRATPCLVIAGGNPAGTLMNPLIIICIPGAGLAFKNASPDLSPTSLKRLPLWQKTSFPFLCKGGTRSKHLQRFEKAHCPSGPVAESTQLAFRFFSTYSFLFSITRMYCAMCTVKINK